jgi:dephospho-CoA kinase
MHPKMADMIRKEIINYKNQGIEFIILEAAILIEANWLPLVDEVWVVTASEDTVVERVIARNNFPEEAIRARINSQLTNAERIKYATLVIENNKLLSDLANAVNEIWKDKIG